METNTELPATQTKTFGAGAMKTLFYIGLVGAFLMMFDTLHPIFSDIDKGFVNVLSVIGNVLYSISLCVLLYCTMTKFEFEGVTSPSKGLFLTAIIFQALSALFVVITNNFENASDGIAIIAFICLLAYLVITLILGIGFCNAHHVALGIGLILLPIIECVMVLWLDENDLPRWMSHNKTALTVIIVVYLAIYMVPIGYLSSLLTGETKDTE